MKEKILNEKKSIGKYTPLEIDGVTMTVEQWAERVHISTNTIFYRYKKGKRGKDLVVPRLKNGRKSTDEFGESYDKNYGLTDSQFDTLYGKDEPIDMRFVLRHWGRWNYIGASLNKIIIHT